MILTKIEENERKKEWKRKLMLILVAISRFVTKKSPFASLSLLLLLQSSSMEVWERVWSYPMNPHSPSKTRFILHLKPKTQQKPKHNWVENEGSQKTEITRGEEAPPRSSRGAHWPWYRGFAGTLRFAYLPWSAGCLLYTSDAADE